MQSVWYINRLPDEKSGFRFFIQQLPGNKKWLLLLR